MRRLPYCNLHETTTFGKLHALTIGNNSVEAMHPKAFFLCMSSDLSNLPEPEQTHNLNAHTTNLHAISSKCSTGASVRCQ